MKYKVWSPDLSLEEDEAREVEARDAESAAILFVEEDDCCDGEYHIAANGECEVFVQDGDRVRTFTVHGEWEPSYTVWECDNANPT